MKRLLFATLTFIGLQASAQKIAAAKVPAIVKEIFAKTYPKATAKWVIEDKNYEAAFKQNDKDISILIDAKGMLLETETSITKAELPKAVAGYLATHYKGKKIAETAMIKKTNGDIIYETEVNKVDVIFDAKGNFLKEVKQ